MVEVDIHAAGGVVVRMGDSGAIEVAIVHRPHYDDWTHPKGKLDPGETSEQAALREVLEETGLRCALGPELPLAHYSDRKGRAKEVRYWRMEVEGGAFAANDEVDELRWLSLAQARELLSFERDRELLDAL